MSGVRVIRAWSGRHEAWTFALAQVPTVADALEAVRVIAPAALEGVAGTAVFGMRVQPETPLRDGDRLELLEALQADPKDARRRRAAASRDAR